MVLTVLGSIHWRLHSFVDLNLCHKNIKPTAFRRARLRVFLHQGGNFFECRYVFGFALNG